MDTGSVLNSQRLWKLGFTRHYSKWEKQQIGKNGFTTPTKPEGTDSSSFLQ